MNTVSAATHSPLRFVSGWRVQTSNWLGTEQVRLCEDCTRVRLIRATQGVEPDQRYWVYALEPATANQLRMVEIFLAEHIIEIETWHTNEPAHAQVQQPAPLAHNTPAARD